MRHGVYGGWDNIRIYEIGGRMNKPKSYEEDYYEWFKEGKTFKQYVEAGLEAFSEDLFEEMGLDSASTFSSDEYKQWGKELLRRVFDWAEKTTLENMEGGDR